METRNQQAKRFGQILEAGYRRRDARDAAAFDLRDAVIQMTVDGAAPGRKRYLIASGIVAAAAAAFLIVMLPGLSVGSFGFYVGGAAEQADLGELVRTGAKEKNVVRFTDGSRFEVGAKTEARIVEADADRVTVDLNTGTLQLNVVPGKQHLWTVRAGPYAVQVVGTQFGVDWDSGAAKLMVEVTRGRVLVRGPGIDARGIYVAAGRLLRAEQETGLVAYGPASELRDTDLAPESVADAPKTTVADENDAEPRPVVTTNSDKRAPHQTWKSLVQKKQYKAALAAAKKMGLDKLGHTLSSDELWSLATAARYAGASKEAVMMFEAHRNRFSNSPRSKTAAYLLAVLALDQQGDTHAAKQWLETYLREAANGSLDEEALGRLMRLNARMGQDSAARRHAAAYLEKYPKGHFSEQARSILNP